MEPIRFEGCDPVAYGENQPEYKPLPGMTITNSEVITCWRLSPEEIEKVKETGVLWISMMTFGHPLQPIFPTVDGNDLFYNVPKIESDNQE